MKKILVIFLFFVAAVFSAFRDEAGAAAPVDSPYPAAAKGWGIEILSLRLTGAGHMLDLRYKVEDAGRAAALFNPKTRAFVVDDNTGMVVGVPSVGRIGRLQQTKNPPVGGKTYFMFFDNPGVFKKGGTVTLVINDQFFEKIKID